MCRTRGPSPAACPPIRSLDWGPEEVWCLRALCFPPRFPLPLSTNTVLPSTSRALSSAGLLSRVKSVVLLPLSDPTPPGHAQVVISFPCSIGDPQTPSVPVRQISTHSRPEPLQKLAERMKCKAQWWDFCPQGWVPHSLSRGRTIKQRWL